MSKPWIREDRKNKALKHYEYTSEAFMDETRRSIGNSVVYNVEQFDITSRTGIVPDITVEALTTEQAVYKYGPTSHCTVLNFASFTRPGGGFITGAIAQEEAICHVSNLYDILSSYTSLYNDNYKNWMNNGLYKDWAIWTPDVKFLKNEQTFYEEIYNVDVITCPAPNAWSARKIPGAIPEGKIDSIMRQRCKYVLDIAETHCTSTLILGAFGCGVFANNPTKVATYFKELLLSRNYNFKNVIFAIPPGENLDAFKNVFNFSKT